MPEPILPVRSPLPSVTYNLRAIMLVLPSPGVCGVSQNVSSLFLIIVFDLHCIFLPLFAVIFLPWVPGLSHLLLHLITRTNHRPPFPQIINQSGPFLLALWTSFFLMFCSCPQCHIAVMYHSHSSGSPLCSIGITFFRLWRKKRTY